MKFLRLTLLSICLKLVQMHKKDLFVKESSYNNSFVDVEFHQYLQHILMYV